MYNTKSINKEFIEYRKQHYFDSRLDDLITCYNMGVRNVLYVVRNNYNQSIRYRVEHMIQAVNESENWNSLMIESACLPLIVPYLKMIDVIIFHRTFYSETESFIKECQKQNKKMFFDIDDYCFHDMCLDDAVISTKVSKESRKKMIDEYRRVYTLCRGVIVSTRFLKDELQKVYDGDIYVIHNFMNKEETEIAADYWSQKMNGCYEDSGFEIGFFSGSNGHDQDFALIRNALYSFMNKHKDGRLVVVGEVELPIEFDAFQNRIKRLSFMTGCQLLNEIARVDLNIVPLAKNKFNEARSEIKYFDAVTVGTRSCFSNVSIYSELINFNDEMNCLCSEDMWLDAIERMYEERNKDVNRFAQIRERVLCSYAFSAQTHELVEFLNEMVKD